MTMSVCRSGLANPPLEISPTPVQWLGAAGHPAAQLLKAVTAMAVHRGELDLHHFRLPLNEVMGCGVN